MARDKRPDQLPSRDCAAMSLADFIEHASGGTLTPPRHLGKYFELCESLGQSRDHLTQEELIASALHICVSVPPQHAKTTTIQYTIAWLLFRFPRLVFGFGSYAKLYSSNRTDEIMRIYVNAGGELMKDHARKDDWRTAGGGGCIAFSPDSGISGYKMNHIVFDDFVHDEKALDTTEKRAAIHREIDLVTQRLWPGGSIIMIATRWHPEDPIGYMLGKGYDEINLPAISEDEDGTEHALWPAEKPLAWLNQKRLPNSTEHVGEYAWATQYQGTPKPQSGAVFGPPRWYDALPVGASIVVVGADLAYGATSSADWSVVVVLACANGIYYVHDVRRVQQSTVEVQLMLRGIMTDYPGVRIASYVAGPEKGILNLLFHNGIPIERMPARMSKWARSQRTAIAYKAGRILVRRDQPWSATFVREVEFFTGNENAHDDQVDALVSAFDLIEASSPVGWAGAGFAFGRAVM